MASHQVRYKVGQVVSLGDKQFVHLSRIGEGKTAFVDSFLSTDTEATGGDHLVVLKTSRTNVASLTTDEEKEIYVKVQEAAEKSDEDNAMTNPCINLYQSGNYDGRTVLVMQQMLCSLDLVIEDRSVMVDEVFTCTAKILKLLIDLHSCDFVHFDVRPANLFLDYEDSMSKSNHCLTLIQAALEETVDDEARAFLMTAATELTELGSEPKLPPDLLSISLVDIKLGGLKSCKPKVKNQRYIDGGAWCYLPPEALLQGKCTCKSDVYSACLVVAELALGTRVYEINDGSDEEMTRQLLSQMQQLNGPFDARFLATTRKQHRFFLNGVLIEPINRDVNIPTLRQLCAQLLAQHSAWEKEDADNLFQLLTLGLHHSPSRRLTLDSLLLMVPK